MGTLTRACPGSVVVPTEYEVKVHIRIVRSPGHIHR